ncbi:RNase P and RNase MRP subunit [Cytospora paraplurivora]|uniref:RNase P and RNase MRP subunit n=1 Tax=Cytospora paraplurivora TaxID=2898453 RepID=A0AAN9U1B3_9PEZI
MRRPRISQDDQDEILDLLCNLLSPISQYRKSYIQPSKGKRSKTRKRKRGQADEPEVGRLVPPPPIVAASVDVGLSNITRNLQSSAAAPSTERDGPLEGHKDSSRPGPYSIIFVSRSGPPSTFFSHFPQMVAVASKSLQLDEPLRLVGFSKSCEDRLSACLGVPRVSSLAIRLDSTAQSRALVEFVRQRVPPVEAPWFEETAGARFLETNISTFQAPIGKKRQKKV